jgi:alpha-amylase
MCTKFFSDGNVHKYFNPYDTPYEAFINYMNVLSDFILRVNDAMSVSDVKETPETPVKGLARRPAKKAAEKKTAAKKPAAKKSPKTK